MKPEEQPIESLLGSVPTKRLEPADASEILSAIRAAGERRPSWWRRGIPAWQAAAACLIVAIGAAWLDRAIIVRSVDSTTSRITAHEPEKSPPSGIPGVVLAGLRESMGGASRPAYQTDLRHWRVIRSGDVE